MLLRLGFCCLISLSSSHVFAATQAAQKRSGIQKTSYASSQTRQATSTSLSNDGTLLNGGKSAGISGRAGFFVGGVMSYGLDLYKDFGSGLQIGGLYTQGHDEQDIKGDDQFKANLHGEIDTKLGGPYARKFFSKTFSGTLGAMYRSANISVAADDVNLGRYKGTVFGSSLGIMAQIGNRWQWNSGLMIGCDWIGYTIPVAQLGQSGEFSGDGFSIKDKKLWEDLSKNIAMDPIAQILMLDVGFRF